MPLSETIAALKKARQRAGGEMAAAPQPEPGIGSRILDTVLSGAEPVMNALDWTGRHTRAAAANLLEALGREPIERTGKETWFGRAPSGRELAGLGTGTLGQFEPGDILGFGVEALADPINLLGVGALSKGGQAAARLGKLERSIKALEALGAGEKAAGPLTAARFAAQKAVRDKLLQEGAAPLAKTLAEQGKLGQRSLLSLHVPFTRLDAGLPLVGGKVASEAGLGALGAVGRGIAYPFKATGIADKFRLAGRTGIDELDAIAEEKDALLRQFKMQGTERASMLASKLASMSPEDAEWITQVEEAVRPEIARQQIEAIKAGRFLGMSERAIARKLTQLDIMLQPDDALEVSPAVFLFSKGAQRASLPGLIEKEQLALSDLSRRLKPLEDLRDTLIKSRDPDDLARRVALLEDSLQNTTDPAEIKALQKEVRLLTKHIPGITLDVPGDAASLRRQINGLTRQAQHGMTKSIADRIARIEARMENMRLKTSARVTMYRAQGKVADAFIEALPADLRDEVLRQTALTGERLALEQARGVPVTALHDPALTYLRRVTTPEFREWTKRQQMGTPWHRLARAFETRGPFMEMRTREWEGFDTWQIEAIARQDGFAGKVFVDNPSEVILRREIEGAQSTANALYLQGAIRAFHTTPDAVPAGVEGIPIENVIATINKGKPRITKLGEQSLERLEQFELMDIAPVPQQRRATKPMTRTEYNRMRAVKRGLEYLEDAPADEEAYLILRHGKPVRAGTRTGARSGAFTHELEHIEETKLPPINTDKERWALINALRKSAAYGMFKPRPGQARSAIQERLAKWDVLGKYLTYPEELNESELKRLLIRAWSVGDESTRAIIAGTNPEMAKALGVLDYSDLVPYEDYVKSFVAPADTGYATKAVQGQPISIATGEIAHTESQVREALKGTRYEGAVIPRPIVDAITKNIKVMSDPDELNTFNTYLDKYMSSMRYWVTSAAVTIPGIKAMGTLAGTAVGGAAGAAIGGATAGVSGAIAGGLTGAGLGLMTTKFGALPLFPQYHMRNAMSNAFMMWLADFRDPRYMSRAWKAIDEYENILGGPAGADAFKYASKDVQAIRQATIHGAFGEGQTGELAALLRMAHPDQPKTRLGRLAAPVTAPGTTHAGQAGLNIGNRIENASKLALFIEGMEKKGMSVGEAADRVKKFLFNYSDLSPFEKKYLRRWAFFYTWERKAMPLMWEQVVTNPRKMRMWGLATGQITDSEQERDLREYQKARNPFYGGPGTTPGSRIFWDLGLPPSELFAFTGEHQPGWGGVRRALQKVAGRTAPVLRGPAELVSGVDLASGQPATAQRALLGLTPATRVARLLQNITGTLQGESSDTGGWPLLGFSPMRANANTAANQKKLDAMNAWLANERFMGRVREWKGYKAAEEAQEPFYAPRLKYRRQLEEALKKQRQ